MKRSFKSLVVGACKQLLGNNQRIRALESERLNLLLEIDELKRMADTKTGFWKARYACIVFRLNLCSFFLAEKISALIWDRRRNGKPDLAIELEAAFHIFVLDLHQYTVLREFPRNFDFLQSFYPSEAWLWRS